MSPASIATFVDGPGRLRGRGERRMLAASVISSVLARVFALALVVVLLGMCAVEIVHAAMPHDEPMDCATRLCDGRTGCVAAGAVMLQGVPVAGVLPSPTMAASAETVTTVPALVSPSPPPPRPLLPSAPRSPPLL